MSKSKLSDRRVRKDAFHQRARREGFAARAVFKLQEIDERLGLVAKGMRVLDLGCAPGSWLQYCSKQAGNTAVLVGVDRGPIELSLPNFRMIVGDVFEIAPAELLGELEAFDLVLSDMAPDTTGIRHVDQARSEALFEHALLIAQQTLAPGGSFVGKLFQGADFQRLVVDCRKSFDKVKNIKPKGSRTSSIEQYVCCTGFHAS
jgi:23S rRNA (uridine2552-2'-O)-methyltransferase